MSLHYVVVEFTEEWENGTVPMAVVSSLWLTHKNSKYYCYWPNYYYKGSERIKAMVDHVSPDISRCGLSIVSIKYKSDNYQQAVAKLKLLENQSSVSQTDEDDETENRKRQPKTRQPKTRQLQDFVEHISSSDDEEIPVPPNVTIDTVVANKPILNKSIKHLADLDTPQMSPAGSDSSVTISASVSSKHLPPQPQQTNVQNLLRELIQAVYGISRDVQYLIRLVQNSNIGDDTLQPSAELDVLPATSSEDLENLNRNLENADFLNALILTEEYIDSVFDKDDVECLYKANISAIDAMQYFDNKTRITLGIPALYDFIECVAERVGGITHDGKFDFVLIKNQILQKLIPFMFKDKQIENEEQLANTAIEKCKSVDGKSMGEKLVKLHNCVIDVIVV
ncbi:hypothetical protein RN001_001021 [Aquatica leii]|uniref:DUF4806 domain-containing protein n=1 Tax=Aquatica leii TaxID=1421715 RepID=A0AAN7QA32_9COLE|nr:hypothetical protein RN001_001021 [Aquatica leii]